MIYCFMNSNIKMLILNKFIKNFIFFEKVSCSILRKKKFFFLINYQNGMNFYYYNGLENKISKPLLHKQVTLYRIKDCTSIRFLLYSPLIIYFF